MRSRKKQMFLKKCVERSTLKKGWTINSTNFQRWINVEISTLKSRPFFNIESTSKNGLVDCSTFFQRWTFNAFFKTCFFLDRIWNYTKFYNGFIWLINNLIKYNQKLYEISSGSFPKRKTIKQRLRWSKYFFHF